jgi:hypothetical protein
MLRTETVEAGTLDLIKTFMSDHYFNEFNLVGGTALALKIGHRISIDIDLFSTTPFNSSDLGRHLTTTYQATEVRVITNGVFCFVNNIKIDLLTHQYPLVKNIDVTEGVRMVSLLDIGAMKLNAIFGSGKRLKDFVDMYALLEIYPLEEMLDACRQKYVDLNINMVKNSLIFHDDIIFTPIEFLGAEINWPEIAERLKNSYHNPHTTFGITETTPKLMRRIQAGEKRKKGGQ